MPAFFVAAFPLVLGDGGLSTLHKGPVHVDLFPDLQVWRVGRPVWVEVLLGAGAVGEDDGPGCLDLLVRVGRSILELLIDPVRLPPCLVGVSVHVFHLERVCPILDPRLDEAGLGRTFLGHGPELLGAHAYEPLHFRHVKQFAVVEVGLRKVGVVDDLGGGKHELVGPLDSALETHLVEKIRHLVVQSQELFLDLTASVF